MIKLRILAEKINIRGLEVRPIESDSEKNMFNDYMLKHYLKSNPSSINIRFGIFYENKMVGIIAYGPPTSVSIIKELGLNSGEVIELRRLFIDDDLNIHNPESQSISLANKELKHIKPNTKIIVTYADPSQGHLGTIYKATNAVYIGKGTGKTGKHKYIYILTNRFERDKILNTISNNKNEAITEWSYRRLHSSTPPIFKDRSRDVNVKLITKTPKGRYVYETTTVSNGNKHRQWIKPQKGIKIDNMNNDIILWCDCGNFTYENETVLWRANTSHKINSNGMPPAIRNPKRVKKLCKHLVAVLDDFKRRI